MQSNQRRCLAGIYNSAQCSTKCMRKQWILAGYSTQRHKRKRQQKQDLQLLRCPFVMLLFMTAVGGQFHLDIEKISKDVGYQNWVGKCSQNLGNRVWIQKKGWGIWYTHIYSPFPWTGSTAMPITLQLSFQLLWSVEKHVHILTPNHKFNNEKALGYNLEKM